MPLEFQNVSFQSGTPGFNESIPASCSRTQNHVCLPAAERDPPSGSCSRKDLKGGFWRRRLRAAREARSRSAAREPRERPALELADALAGEIELVPDRLERPGLALEAEAELEDAPLALRERVERAADALLAQRLLRLVERVGGLAVGKEVSRPSSSAPTVWFSETDACAAPSASSTCWIGRPVASASSSFVARAELDLEPAGGARQPLLPLDDVDGDADRPRVFATARCTDWRIHQVA